MGATTHWIEDLSKWPRLMSIFGAAYEMATARPAFSGKTLAVIYDAILDCNPTALLRLNPRLQSKLVETINKALEKDRETRYQHASSA